MKAAVLHELGHAPRYEDFPDPVAQDNQLLINVKAASVKNLDKGRASGAHYAAHTNLPEVVGVDGVGILPDGRRVYAMGITGMIAEKALISKTQFTLVPDGVDDITAAALPNAVLGAAMALKFRAGMSRGKRVLVNGATGVTGKLALQLARYYGASSVIATGRNQQVLDHLPALGADEVLSIREEEHFVRRLKEIHAQTPIDIVIDYTWGQPVEWIFRALKGGGLHAYTHPVRLVTVGSMAGEQISLSSATLRSSAIEIAGSGLGSITKEQMTQFGTDILPDVLRLAAEGTLKIDTVPFPLAEVEQAWKAELPSGSRLVIEI